MSFFLSHQRAIPWKYLADSFFVSNIIPIFAFRYHRWYVFNWKYNNFISFYQSHPNIFHAVPGLQEQDWLYGSDQLYAAKYLTYMPSCVARLSSKKSSSYCSIREKIKTKGSRYRPVILRSEPVDDIEYFVTLLRYIHQNPLKAGITENINDFHGAVGKIIHPISVRPRSALQELCLPVSVRQTWWNWLIRL